MIIYIIVFILIVLLLLWKSEQFIESIQYRLFICLALPVFFGFFVFQYIGINGGTPRLNDRRNLSFHQTGVYSINDSVRFENSDARNTYKLEFLRNGDRISMHPMDISDAKIQSWELRFISGFLPLRINKEAKNVLNNQHLDYGETLTFQYFDTTKVVVDLSLVKNPEKNRGDIYIIKTRKNGNNTTETVDSVSFVQIKDGIIASRLLKNAKNLNKNIQNSQQVKQIFNNLFLFRKIRNNVDSPLCFNINYESNDFSINKISGINSYEIIPDQNHLFTDTVYCSDNCLGVIRYGYGTEISELRLSDSFMEIDLDEGKQAKVAPVYIVNSPGYYLPEDGTNSFYITSHIRHITQDYLFALNTNENMRPVYAKVELTDNSDSLIINSGMSLKKTGIEDVFNLDNGEIGFLLRFSKFRYSYSGIPLPLLIVISLVLSFLLLAIVIVPEFDNSNDAKVKLLWTLIISAIIFIAFFRLILSYRVIAFPPESANIKELVLLKKSLGISLMSLLVIPVIIYVTFLKRIFNLSILYQIGSTAILAITTGLIIYNYYDKLTVLLFLLPLFTGTVLFRESKYFNSFKKFVSRYTSVSKRAGVLKYGRLVISATAFGILTGLSFGVDGSGSVAGTRYNILSILFLFFILFNLSYFLKKKSHSSEKSNKVYEFIGHIFIWIYYPLLFIVTILNYWQAKDSGFVLVYFPLFCIIPLTWYFLEDKKKPLRHFIAVLIFAIGATATITFVLPNIPAKFLPEDKFIYRLKADNPEYWYEFDENIDAEFNTNLFLNNTYQMWQLKNYAAHGEWLGKGYAQSKFINTGVTIPVSLTDGVFSIYIFSEFGVAGGIGLILLFILILWLIISIALRFKEGNYNLIWLVLGIGIYLVHTTYYMALVNIGAGKIPFTGQNIPFFSLSSLSDALHFIILMIYLGIILNNREEYYSDISEYSDEGYERSYKTILSLAGIYTALVLIFGYYAISLIYSGEAKEDFKLPQKYVDEFHKYYENGYLVLNKDSAGQDRLKLSPKAKPLSNFFIEQINNFNSREDEYKKNPEYGLIYMDNETVELNRNYYNIKSPFKDTYLWEEKIYSHNDNDTVYKINFYNTSVKLNLSSDLIQMMTLKIPDDLNSRRIYNSSCIQLINSKRKNLLEITRDSRGVSLNSFRDDDIWINGKPLKAGNRAKQYISSKDIIVVREGNKGLKYYFSLDKNKGELLSRLAWVNGVRRRIYPLGEDFTLAFNISQAASLNKLEANSDLTLSVDKELQLKIQKRIREFVSHNSLFSLNKDELHNSKQIAFTVMDSYSGEILALGSWPNFDPNDSKINEYFNSLNPVEESRVLYNPNLRDHVMGSTFKPLTYSAMALTFNPQTQYDISNFEVYHERNSLGNDDQRRYEELVERKIIEKRLVHPHLYLAGMNLDIDNRNNEFWDCNQEYWGLIDKDIYLTNSINYYQLVLFALGLIQENEFDELHKFLKNRNTPDKRYSRIKFGSIEHYLDVSPSLSIGDQEVYGGFWSGNLPESIIFKNLKLLYSVNLERDPNFNRYNSISDLWQRSLENFMPSFADKKGGSLKNIIPHPVNMNIDVMRDRRDMKVLMRGGGDHNRWNNIHACEAFSRITTGLYVEATLQPNNSKIFPPLPYPMSTDWRMNNIFKGLQNSARYGTSASCFPSYMINDSTHILAKTGTLEERMSGRESELLIYTIGRRYDDESEFIAGKTYTCYLYMEDSHIHESVWFRGNLNKKLSEIVFNYLLDNREEADLEPNPDNSEDVVNYVRDYNKTSIKDINLAMDYNNPVTRNFALRSVRNYPGSHNIYQICSLYDNIVNRWSYVSDPLDNEYFAAASESIAESDFTGDCDDFAILMAACMRAIGRVSQIALASNNESGHAFAEVKINNDMGWDYTVKNQIIKYYRNRGVNLSSSDINITERNGERWLNLDWWSQPYHVGGPYFDYDEIRFIR